MSFGNLLPPGIFPRDVLLYWDGGPADRIKKTAFADTDITAGTNIHRANSRTFNGTSSKIDCGADTVGVGNVTGVCWINPVGFGEGNNGRFVDNGKFFFKLNSVNATFGVISDGTTTTAVAATNSIVLDTDMFLAATRTSAGVCNFYKNGVLSGSANQASGTPAAGSTNMFIGANNAGDRTFNGTISHIRVFSKILTVDQIRWIYNKER